MNKTIEELKLLIKEFPTGPGVYLMKDANEKVIYVGKAKNIRARTRTYFTALETATPKTALLVRNIKKIEFLLTGTEVEAFLVEASLIKKHRPRYNIRLKDDKAYPYIRANIQDEWPRLNLVRRVKKDGAVYFGPYTNSRSVWETIRFLNQAFQIRDCTDAFFATRKRPCMTYQIGRCKAPCVKLVTEREYRKDVDGAVAFLRGKDKETVDALNKNMLEASHDEKFEIAARLRDSINAVTRILERQAVVDASSEVDQDVLSFFGTDRGTYIEILHVRAGRVIGNRGQFMPMLDPSDPAEDPRDWLSSFINQYYFESVVPDELLLPVDLGNDIHKLLEAVLKERSGQSVKMHLPTDETRQRLMDMANRNAKVHYKDYLSKSEQKQAGLEEIQKRLGLALLPKRIECYDISTFQGKETVASQVVFEDGVPSKDHYKRYRIKTVEGINDFESMREVLSRRFKHAEWEDPQLIVIDGGKGQLGIACEVLKEIDKNLPVVGLAKARTLGDFSETETTSSDERFFIPGRANPIVFQTNSMAYQILVGIRDEAHRFAITYHRKLRENTTLESALDLVTGLGESKKKQLLQTFGSVRAIQEASVAALTQIKGISTALAERILQTLRDDEEPVDR